MKVILLAGGLGTRISEYTKTIPKPMIKIKGKPILVRIMEHYYSYGFNDFYIALGHKGNIIKKFFIKNKFPNWKIKLIKTGNKTMTGGRLKKLTKYIANDTFMLTYGDGLSDVNLNKLLNFHKKNNKLVTVTAVRPPARFGALKFNGFYIKTFKEKSKLDEGWINGGFFVMEPEFLKYIDNNNSYLEKKPLETAAKNKQLVGFKHRGFWQCMDTKRDKDYLETIFKK